VPALQTSGRANFRECADLYALMMIELEETRSFILPNPRQDVVRRSPRAACEILRRRNVPPRFAHHPVARVGERPAAFQLFGALRVLRPQGGSNP
jgi:hypothetical protein